MEDCCQVCRFSVSLVTPADGESSQEEFFCQRYPPAVNRGSEGSHGIFPVVDPDDWCGEFLAETTE